MTDGTPAQPRRKVDITVGDHIVIIESDAAGDDLDSIAVRALYLHTTTRPQTRPPAGFDPRQREALHCNARREVIEYNLLFPRTPAGQHPTAADRLLATVAIAEAAELLGIAQLTALVRTVITNQEATMSDFEDLRRAVAENTAVDNRLIAGFEDLRDKVAALPTDRPLREDEQQALNEAVEALTAQTAAVLRVFPDPGTGVATDTGATPAPGGTATPGSTVIVAPSDPAPVLGPQGGTVDLSEDHPSTTGGVGPVLADPSSSTPISTADQPPAGEAAEVKADEDAHDDVPNPSTPATDSPLLEPAPADAPLSESPGDRPADDHPFTESPVPAPVATDDPDAVAPQPTDVQMSTGDLPADAFTDAVDPLDGRLGSE